MQEYLPLCQIAPGCHVFLIDCSSYLFSLILCVPVCAASLFYTYSHEGELWGNSRRACQQANFYSSVGILEVTSRMMSQSSN